MTTVLNLLTHVLQPHIILYGFFVMIQKQGRNDGGQGCTIPRAPNHYWDAEKSQQCHKYFLQYNTFASERHQIRTWGRQTSILPRAPSNLVTPLLVRVSLMQDSHKLTQS